MRDPMDLLAAFLPSGKMIAYGVPLAALYAGSAAAFAGWLRQSDRLTRFKSMPPLRPTEGK